MISAQHQESYTSCLIIFLKCRYSCHNFLKDRTPFDGEADS